MRLRTKAIAAFGVALALTVGVFLVWAQITQQEESSGRVTVIGNLLAVSPETDWLVIETLAGGGNSESGVQKLTFTNDSDVSATVEGMKLPVLTQDPPGSFNGSVFLWRGWAVAGVCPDPLSISGPLEAAQGLGTVVAPHTSAVLCGELMYDGTGPAEGGELLIDFIFETVQTP